MDIKSDLEFEIKKNDCSNLDELIDLTKQYYTDADIVNKDYLNWQYFSNPCGSPYLFTSRELKTQELAGQYIVIPVELSIKTRLVNAALSLNTLTSPKYQGLGLFTKMAKSTYQNCETNGVEYVIGFPNQNSYPGFVRKLGFSHLGDISFVLKPLRPIHIVGAILKKNKTKHGDIIQLTVTNISNIEEFDFNNEEHQNLYTEFWIKMKEQYKVCLNKEFKYMKWRFSEIPTRKYKIFFYAKDDQMLGFVILKAAKVWGFRAGVIVDFMIENNDTQVGEKLITYIKKISQAAKLDILACLHTKNYEYNILKKNGFLSVPKKVLPQQVPFILKNLNKNNSIEIETLSEWKLTFGDYDIF